MFNMKVIVGLGNPGRKYAPTKHNTGYEVIDKLAYDYNIKVTKMKHKSLIGEGVIKGEKVLLVKPVTYMNLSGEAVKEIMSFYKYDISDLIVIYDDTSLPLGGVRIRESGSPGGHNGIKNISAHLGTDKYLRIKVGIGEKPNGWDLADYVLSKFDKDDLPLFIKGVTLATDAVELIIEEGVANAMNKINPSAKPPKKKKEKPAENAEDKADEKSGEKAEEKTVSGEEI